MPANCPDIHPYVASNRDPCGQVLQGQSRLCCLATLCLSGPEARRCSTHQVGLAACSAVVPSPPAEACTLPWLYRPLPWGRLAGPSLIAHPMCPESHPPYPHRRPHLSEHETEGVGASHRGGVQTDVSGPVPLTKVWCCALLIHQQTQSPPPPPPNFSWGYWPQV